MSFGHDSQPSRIFSFGCKPPSTNIDQVVEQMKMSNWFANQLREVEQGRRQKSDQAVKDFCPDLPTLLAAAEAATAEVQELEAAIKGRNSRERRRRATREEQDRMRALKKKKKETWAAYKLRRKAAFADPGFAEANKQVEKDDHAARLAAYAESTVFWCTKLQVIQSAKSFRKGPPPKFRAYRGDGKVAMQIQHGISLEEAHRGDNRLLVGRLPEGAFNAQGRRTGCPARLRRVAVRMRFHSAADGRPIWATVQVDLHRLLPQGSLIKWVFLIKRRVATYNEWRLQFVVSRPGGFPRDDWAPAQDASGRPSAVGVDLGWRLLGDEIRVAYWVGSDGREGELRIPRWEVGRWTKSEEIQARRDLLFNSAVELLKGWLRGDDGPAGTLIQDLIADRVDKVNGLGRHLGQLKPWQNRFRQMCQRQLNQLTAARHAFHRDVPVPDWLASFTEYLADWKGTRRLASLWQLWRQNRFAGDARVFDVLTIWYKVNRHLYDWQEAGRTKARRWRDDLYRCFARQLAREYRTVVLEDCDWSQLQRRPAAEENDTQRQARTYQRVAAVGRLKQVLVEAFAESAKVESAMTTQRCSECGLIDAFDAKDQLVRTCRNCQALRDQDSRAGKNLVNAYLGGGASAVAQTPDPEPTPTA